MDIILDIVLELILDLAIEDPVTFSFSKKIPRFWRRVILGFIILVYVGLLGALIYIAVSEKSIIGIAISALVLLAFVLLIIRIIRERQKRSLE